MTLQQIQPKTHPEFRPGIQDKPATSSRRRSMTAKKGHKRKVGKTPEQRAAEAQALHDTLTAQVEALTTSGQWERYLDFMGSFHAYSFNNLMLILAQRPDAAQVAGFRQWQAKGRQVRKGERAIKIRGFSTKKVTEEDPETGEEAERLLRRFPILSVFDVSQTDPIEGAPQVENPARVLVGADTSHEHGMHGGIVAAMTAHLVDQGWSVEREPMTGRNGYTTTDGTRRVVIAADLDGAQAAKTILHEAAHVTLHAEHLEELEDDGPAEYVTHRGVYETEAESVAYVLAGLAGLDTSAYSVGYVAGWGSDRTTGATAVEAVQAAAENVLRCVQHLIPALFETTDAEEGERSTSAAG